MNLWSKFAIRIPLVFVVFVGVSGNFGFGEEPAAEVKGDVPAVVEAKPVAAKPAADEAKPADPDKKTEADQSKDKPAADAGKPVKKDRAARAKAAKPGAADAVAAPLRLLFGGPAEAPAMAPAQIGVQAAPADVADNDPMMLQFLQQYRPMLTSELSFVRLVCDDLTAEQRPKIKAAADAALKKVARQMANQQNRAQRGIAMQMATIEPGKTIRDAISKSLQETLTEAQMLRYNDEATKRTADRKKASILSVVARLDGQLFLTAEQREKIEKAISSRWQDAWEKWLMMAASYGDRYFPTIPNECVNPHLNPEQLSVWNGLQKVDFGWWGGNGQELENDGWWGPEAANEEAAAGLEIRAIEVKVGF